jgi:cellulase/cellobiase CelA1
MIEHLFNCHGEWQILLTALGSAPIVGVWFRALFVKRELKSEDR